MRQPGMHAGNLATSDRLKRLDAFLRLRGPRGATSIEIADVLRSAAPGTDASELRMNLRRHGETVECRPEGLSTDGRKIFRYRIVPFGPAVGGGVTPMASKPDAPDSLSPRVPPPSPEPPVIEPMLDDLDRHIQAELFRRYHA